jgi:hypothetical protein
LAPFDPPNLEAERWWLGDPGRTGAASHGLRHSVWLGKRRAQLLAAMCQTQIEKFYAEQADADRQVRYFVEKSLPSQAVPDLLFEIYRDAREIVLVRDFRDILCSIIAFDAKRGYKAFGRDRTESDADYVTSSLRRSAESLLHHWDRRKRVAHLIRYEDLVMNPAETLIATLQYLGLDSTPATIEETIARAADQAAGTDMHRTVSDPIASIGRWKRDLAPELSELCAEALDPVLSRFGYSTTRTMEPMAGERGSE